MIVRRIRPVYRLQSLMHAPGGMTIAAALQRAHEALDEVKGQCVAGIDEKIEAIACLAVKDLKPEGAAAMYEAANEVFNEAGVFGLTEVSEAAHSLCTLLSAPDGAAASAAIRVHADALRVLRHPDVCDNAGRREEVIEGLRSVSSRAARDDESVE